MVIADREYYVSADGSDSNNGNSINTAVATLNKVISLAKAENYNADHTILAYINGTVNWGGTLSGSIEALTAHTFKLVIMGLNGQEDILGAGTNNIKMGGPSEFRDITLNLGNNYKYLALHGSSTLMETVTFTSPLFDLVVGLGSGNYTYNKRIDVILNIPRQKIFVGNIYGSATFNQDVNIEYNAGEGEVIIQLGSNNNQTIFNKGLNITLNAPVTPTFTKNTSVTFGTNGFMQIINNNSNYEIPRDNTFSRLWVLNSNTLGLIHHTNTMGRFRVGGGYIATATDISGNTYQSSDWILTLPAEQYTVTGEVEEEQGAFHSGKYYISNCYSTHVLTDFTVDSANNSNARSWRITLDIMDAQGDWLSLTNQLYTGTTPFKNELAFYLGDIYEYDIIKTCADAKGILLFSLKVNEYSNTSGTGTVLNTYRSNIIQTQMLDPIAIYESNSHSTAGVARVWTGTQWMFSKIAELF